MKELFAGLATLATVGGKNASLIWIYGAAAVLSLLLLTGCCCVVRKKRLWFVLLFSSVLVVNAGYTFLSVSTSLEMALMANRISYLGSVFLPFAMLMILLNVTNTAYGKRIPGMLLILAALMFLVAASPGILDIYYKAVSLKKVDGVSVLEKVYGPLHPLYLFYLLGYFGAMIWVIIQARVRKTIDTTAHAVILAIAVLVNIGVWLIEQLTRMNFEFLSVSYIISELFLLGAHLVMKENQQLWERIRLAEKAQTQLETTTGNAMRETLLPENAIPAEQIEVFLSGMQKLTPTERLIFDAHIARATTQEIMANLNIKENTLKFHNRNLYGKLGVSSRKELLEVNKQAKTRQEYKASH